MTKGKEEKRSSRRISFSRDLYKGRHFHIEPKVFSTDDTRNTSFLRGKKTTLSKLKSNSPQRVIHLSQKRREEHRDIGGRMRVSKGGREKGLRDVIRQRRSSRQGVVARGDGEEKKFHASRKRGYSGSGWGGAPSFPERKADDAVGSRRGEHRLASRGS